MHTPHVVSARSDVSDSKMAKGALAGVTLADCPTMHNTSLSLAIQLTS